MMTTNKLGLYIHIPFCVRKCAYCDFLSFACDDKTQVNEYVNALMREIKIRSQNFYFREVDSVYIGGGTPSLITEWDMGKIMDCLNEYFNISEDAEITIEANPTTLSDEKIERYLRKGINRLSIGVQSFDNSMLGILGRIHDKNDAFYSFQRAKKMGFDNINLDIIFGIPRQSMKTWKDTVRQCVFARPTHISLYSLQIEEGTKMYDMCKIGKYEPTPDALDREMYHTALKMIRDAGYEHYEISNCALEGCRSRHNMKYWSYDEYLGLGLGASSFTGGKRYKNVSDMREYIDIINRDRKPTDTCSVEEYTQREEMGIYMFTGLRKTEGVSSRDFAGTFHRDIFDVYPESILRKYRGLLIFTGDRLYLTERGMDISNRIMAEFL